MMLNIRENLVAFDQLSTRSDTFSTPLRHIQARMRPSFRQMLSGFQLDRLTEFGLNTVIATLAE